jgi:hypothetical protein
MVAILVPPRSGVRRRSTTSLQCFDSTACLTPSLPCILYIFYWRLGGRNLTFTPTRQIYSTSAFAARQQLSCPAARTRAIHPSRQGPTTEPPMQATRSGMHKASKTSTISTYPPSTTSSTTPIILTLSHGSPLQTRSSRNPHNPKIPKTYCNRHPATNRQDATYRPSRSTASPVRNLLTLSTISSTLQARIRQRCRRPPAPLPLLT